MSKFKQNCYGVNIKRCCASCQHKAETRLITMRHCKRHDKDVNPIDHCSDWCMSDNLRMAGRGEGEVKRKEYLLFVLNIREQEAIAAERGDSVVEKSVSELRMVFEKQFGTIYEEKLRKCNQ